MKTEYRFGLIGRNIGYSKSASIFQAALDLLGTPGEFVNYDLEPGTFDAEFSALLQSGVDGFSVTIPYKQKVIAHLDELHPVASALDAVNSIALHDRRTIGFNTDRDGFAYPLRPYSDRLKHARAVVYGYGGSAKAAIYALYSEFELSEFVVVGRDPAKLRAFADSLRKLLPKLSLDLCPMPERRSIDRERIEILVNCTPVGGWNDPDSSLFGESFRWPNRKIYYDLNYNKGNKIVEAARDSGQIAINGSAMLVAQALRSLQIWTGLEVDFDPVFERVFGKDA